MAETLVAARPYGEYCGSGSRRICEGGAGPGGGGRPMVGGGGVPDGPEGTFDTSLTRFDAGGGSSFKRDIMLEVLRGSVGGLDVPEGVGAGGPGGGAWP